MRLIVIETPAGPGENRPVGKLVLREGRWVPVGPGPVQWVLEIWPDQRAADPVRWARRLAAGGSNGVHQFLLRGDQQQQE